MSILKLISGLLVMVSAAACSLSMTPATAEPTATTIASVPTSTATVTASPTATLTNTPLPTNTSVPATSTPVFRLVQAPPVAVCGLMPTVDAANIRSGAGMNFPIQGVLPAGSWVMARNVSAGGWYQISAPGTVVNGGWISGTVVGLQQPCVCGPNNCTPNFPPPTAQQPVLPQIGVVGLKPSGAGQCVITAGAWKLAVYSAPMGLPPVIAELSAKAGLPTFEYNSGRYAVNFSTETQLYTGWINANEVTLEGDCAPLIPPTVCSVQPSVGRVIDVYAEPSRDAKIISNLNERYHVPFLSFNADGWFSVNLGFIGSGWIAPNEGRLVGPCDNGS